MKGFLQSSEGETRNLYDIPMQLAEVIKSTSVTSDGAEWGMCQVGVRQRYAIELFQFTTQAGRVTAEIVDNVLNFLDWDEILNSLPVEEQQRVKDSQTKFKRGVGHFLGWPREPIYFWAD